MLKRIQTGYALGNVMGDVQVVVQNTYFLLFLTQVIRLDPSSCGILLVLGRLIDCVSGFVAGFIVDRFAPCSDFIDRRKFWHLIGCILIAMSLPLHLIPPPNHDVENVDTVKTMLFYIVSWTLCSIGYALSYISHLTVASILATNDTDSVLLQSLKNAVSKITFVVMNLIATFLISVEEKEENETTSSTTNAIDWSNRHLFMHLGLAGSLASLLLASGFHFFIKSNDLRGVRAIVRELKSMNKNKTFVSGLKWFKRLPFYSFIIFYSLTWAVYLSLMSYQSFYMQITLAVDRRFVSLVPLIQNGVGFGISFGMKPLAKKIGKMALYIIGCCFMLIVSVFIAIGPETMGSKDAIVYILAIGAGIGQSVTLIQAFVSNFLLFFRC